MSIRAKTVTFQVRVTPEDYQRLQRLASVEFIGVATWARRAVLNAATDAEARQKASEQAREDGPPEDQPSKPR